MPRATDCVRLRCGTTQRTVRFRRLGQVDGRIILRFSSESTLSENRFTYKSSAHKYRRLKDGQTRTCPFGKTHPSRWSRLVTRFRELSPRRKSDVTSILHNFGSRQILQRTRRKRFCAHTLSDDAQEAQLGFL